MKQVFYKGLLALTIAFGMTSCDKNDVGELDGPITQVTKGITSKVSFGEAIGLKGDKVDESAKTHANFPHIYSSVDQSIAIKEAGVDGEIVFMGSYEAGNIAGGIIADSGYAVPIILQNGSYRAETMNEGGAGIGYLPYSSSADFVLSSSTGVIALQAVLEAGFLVVNVEAALDGERVSDFTVASQVNGDIPAGDAISLLVDDRDDFGDRYGYLPSATYSVLASYNLDEGTETISASQRVDIGSAYTIELTLLGDTPDVIDSIVSTSTLAGSEATLALNVPARADGGDINDDGDILDTLERVVTSTQATLNGDNVGEPAITNGPWSIVLDIDITASTITSTGTSNEEDESSDVNSDGDEFDTLKRSVSITTTSTTGQADVSNTVYGEWLIDGDYSSAGFGEGTAPVSGDPVDTFSEWSAWSPENADASEAMVVQTRTRTIIIQGVADAVAPVGDLSQTQTVANPASVVDVADVYTEATSSITTGGDVSTIDSGDAVVTFLYGSSSYDSLELAQAAADADASAAGTTVTIVRSSSQGRSIETTALVVTTTTVYTVQINVREDSPALPAKDNLVVPVTTPASSVAGVAVVSTSDLSYAVAADEVVADIAGTITVDFTAAAGLVWSNTGTFSVTAPDGATATTDASVVTFNGAGEYVFALSNALGDTASYTATVDAAGDFTLSIGSAGVVTFN